MPEVYELTQKLDNSEILVAISQIIHEQCMGRVSQRVYLQTLSFLYKWLYSDKFLCDYTFCVVLKDELKKLGYDDDIANEIYRKWMEERVY